MRRITVAISFVALLASGIVALLPSRQQNPRVSNHADGSTPMRIASQSSLPLQRSNPGPQQLVNVHIQPNHHEDLAAAASRDPSLVARWSTSLGREKLQFVSFELRMFKRIDACLETRDSQIVASAADVTFLFERRNHSWRGLSATFHRRANESEDARTRLIVEDCVAQSFVGEPMPILGGSGNKKEYAVRVQFEVPTTNDRLYSELGLQ